MTELHFQLDMPDSTAAFAADGTTPAQPAPFLLRFDGDNSDVSSRGDFDKDAVSPQYPLRWASMTEFKLWLSKLERESVIEFTLQKTYKSARRPQAGFVSSFEYRCSRGQVHGQKPYEKKHDRVRKLAPKATAKCTARVYIKTYANTPVVLGRYDDSHSHSLGHDNARFTRVAENTRVRIADLLRSGATPDAVLNIVNGRSATSGEPVSGADHSVRDTFIELKDIKRIQAAIDAETRHLHAKDDESVLRWVDRLQSQDTLLFFKGKQSNPPVDSGLAPDVLVLIIQSPWQRARFSEFGRNFAGIDGTHNTTQYENTTLFTIIVRDRWGHGVPVAWMISSNGTQATLTFFLRTFRTHNGTVIPRYWMTDKDRPQINALLAVYIEAIILLCWWHVLHAWQQHFSPTAYPELWTLLKSWIRITEEEKFQIQYVAIKRVAPASFTAYLEEHWMPDRAMWSAIDRAERNVFEKSDTNMLVESWHRILKHKFLLGKHNRRLDDLLYTLTVDAMSFYGLKYRRQQWGFEGADQEQLEHQRVLKLSATIPKDHIQDVGADTYAVQSQSDASAVHTVSAKDSSCTCTAFWTIRFCKHMAAVARYYPLASSSLKFASVWCDAKDGEPAAAEAAAATPTTASGTPPPSDVSVQHVQALMQTAMARASTSTTDTEGLRNLSAALKEYIAHADGSGVLPRSVPIPPNIRSTTETQSVLPRAKQSRRAKDTLRYKEPYSAGVRSGTRAKPDALRAPVAGPSSAVGMPPSGNEQNVPPPVDYPSPAASSTTVAMHAHWATLPKHIPAPPPIHRPPLQPALQSAFPPMQQPVHALGPPILYQSPSSTTSTPVPTYFAPYPYPYPYSYPAPPHPTNPHPFPYPPPPPSYYFTPPSQHPRQ